MPSGAPLTPQPSAPRSKRFRRLRRWRRRTPTGEIVATLLALTALVVVAIGGVVYLVVG